MKKTPKKDVKRPEFAIGGGGAGPLKVGDAVWFKDTSVCVTIEKLLARRLAFRPKAEPCANVVWFDRGEDGAPWLRRDTVPLSSLVPLESREFTSHLTRSFEAFYVAANESLGKSLLAVNVLREALGKRLFQVTVTPFVHDGKKGDL